MTTTTNGVVPSFAADTVSATARQEAARQAYRVSVEQGEPLSSAALAELSGRSRTWARERINEVRAETGMPPQPEPPAGEPETADQTPACQVAGPPPVVEPTDVVPAVSDSGAARERHATPVADRTAGMPPARVRSWPVLLIALPAAVAIWAGWVGLGELTGFGPVNLLPGIGGGWVINSAITLPIGVEAYAAYALRVWLSSSTRSATARRFAMWSAIGSLVLGMAGQAAYHLMKAAGITVAPWPITTFVSCLPVVVLGCGAALAHLLHQPDVGKEG